MSNNNAASSPLQVKLVVHAVTPSQETNSPCAIAKRAAQPLFLATFSVDALRPRLPLLYPADPGLPAPPKLRYRSEYRYLGLQRLLDGRLVASSPFQVALCVIDFSPLRPALAQMYEPTRKGQAPFDPVSMFLACCLRDELKLPWRGLAALLAGGGGGEWRSLFGFREGDTPSASGLRYFFHRLDPRFFAELCPTFEDLLYRAGLSPQRSTFPGDPKTRGVTITVDGMLHPARSRPSCQLATDGCYQPLPENRPVEEAGDAQPAPAATVVQRLCRARAHGLEGCACDTPACHSQCRRASALDPEARFVHHDVHDKRQARSTKDGARHKGKGIDIYGFLSITERLIDDRFAIAWNIGSRLLPANTAENTLFPARLAELHARFPYLTIGEVLGDSFLGYPDCLAAIYRLGALRMIDIRADPSDADPEACLRRRYDARGHPLCEHGYPLHPQGYDQKRRRAKWACRRICQRQPRREGEPVTPVVGCPFLEENQRWGQIVNVGATLPDGSMRLARDIPYGTKAWKARYGRRSLSESRNSQCQGMDLKRMRSHGLAHNQRDIQTADWLVNLRTMGRLVKEATALHAASRGS
jgi:hypothetical protein